MTPNVATLVAREGDHRSGPPPVQEPETQGLREIWRTLWRFRTTILVTAFVFVCAVAAVVWQLTPIYQATSVLVIEPKRPVIVDVEAFVSQTVVDMETVSNNIAMLVSRKLADRVIRNLRLYEDPEFNPLLQPPPSSERILTTIFPKSLLESLFGPEKPIPDDPEEMYLAERVRIIDLFLGKLEVVVRESSHVVDINFMSEDPGTAAVVANSIAETHLEVQREAKFDTTRQEAVWLNERITNMREELERAETRVGAYRRDVGLIQGRDQISLTHQQIAEVNMQLIAARSTRAELEARLANLEELYASPEGVGSAAEVLNSDIVADLSKQETEVLRQIAELSAQYGEEHPAMITKRVELRDLRAKTNLEIEKVVANLRNEVAVARAQESSLQESLSQLKDRIMELDAAEATLRVLEREAETASFLYDAFLAKYKESQGFQEFQGADARIISRADVPIVAAFPKKKLFLAIAVVAGIMIGILVAFLQEQFDRGFHSMEQIERSLGIATLGLVPLIKTWRQRPEELILQSPGSAFCESLRAVHTGLILSNVDNPPRTVLVTSCQPKEGKTTLALAMARRLAMSGTKVMLIDADIRKAEIHRKLGGVHGPGLVDYLTGKASAEDVIQTDEATGMKYVAAGESSSQSADMLGSRRMKDLLLQLGSQYEIVIIDAPPTLAVADARLLSNLVDKTLLVVRWATTRREAAALSARQIVEAGGDLAGVVLTMVDVKRNAALGYGDSELFTAPYRRYYAS